MILEKTVKIIINSRNITYYKEKGYTLTNPNSFNIIEVNINDLNVNSKVKIHAKCNECSGVTYLTYQKYNKNIEFKDDKLYSCKKCAGKRAAITFKLHFKDVSPEAKQLELLKKATNLKNNGAENYNNMDKHNETMMKNHGVNYTLESPILRKIIEETNLKNHGVKHNSERQEIKDLISKTLKQNYIPKTIKFYKDKYNIEIQEVKDKTFIVKCNDCGESYEIDKKLFRLRLYYKNNPCLICNPTGSKNTSLPEKHLLNYIIENYDGEILENSKRIIKPLELDIYLPELKIAFEFNGIYYHSSAFDVSPDYHLMKYNICKETGIELIQIFEDDWYFSNHIIKSIILDKLNKNNIISFDDCDIKEITDINIVKQFTVENNLKGYIECKNYICLIYNDDIVSMMGFIDNNIVFHCNKYYNSVLYSDKILIDYYMNNYIINYLEYIIDNTYQNIDYFLNIGFDFIEDILPIKYYVNKNKRVLEQISEKNYTIYDAGYKKIIFKL